MKHAWHFVSDKLRDGRPIPKDGVWLKHEGPICLCQSGLHASIKPIDALRYAPGNTLCRVALKGQILESDDKIVATERKILWRIDAEPLLRAFARWCAIQVLDKWDAPQVVRDFLRTGDESLRAVAWSAAQAAQAAARAVAWSAAQAAQAAVWAAVWAAAQAAARAAVWAAVWAAQDEAFNEFIKEVKAGYTEWELTF